MPYIPGPILAAVPVLSCRATLCTIAGRMQSEARVWLRIGSSLCGRFNVKKLLIGAGWFFLGALLLFGWPLRSNHPRATDGVNRDAMPLPRPSVEESFVPDNGFPVSSAVASLSGAPAAAPLATRVVARASSRPGRRCPCSQGRDHLSCAREHRARVTKKLATSDWQSGRSISEGRLGTVESP